MKNNSRGNQRKKPKRRSMGSGFELIVIKEAGRPGQCPELSPSAVGARRSPRAALWVPFLLLVLWATILSDRLNWGLLRTRESELRITSAERWTRKGFPSEEQGSGHGRRQLALSLTISVTSTNFSKLFQGFSEEGTSWHPQYQLCFPYLSSLTQTGLDIPKIHVSGWVP